MHLQSTHIFYPCENEWLYNLLYTQHNYSPHVGTQPSPTATSPRSCPSGQFSCPPPGGCIAAEQRCDGIPHCPRGEDETGCHPHSNITTQSDRWREIVFISGSYISIHVVITTLYQFKWCLSSSPLILCVVKFSDRFQVFDLFHFVVLWIFTDHTHPPLLLSGLHPCLLSLILRYHQQ